MSSETVRDSVRASIPHADVASDQALLRTALMALRPSYAEGPLSRWVLVRCALGHGSGVGTEICRALGIDPEEEVQPDDLPEWLQDIIRADNPETDEEAP